MVGTWFGPISLFNPIKQTSQIISGMVVFSYILKTEPRPDKEVSHGVFRVSHEKAMYLFVIILYDSHLSHSNFFNLFQFLNLDLSRKL